MMKLPNETGASAGDQHINRLYPMVTLVFSVTVVASVYLVAASELAAEDKSKGFAVIGFLFIVGVGVLYYRRNRKRSSNEKSSAVDAVDIDRGLDALDEAGSFFSGSLRSADAFRLVSSRVQVLVPFQTIVLYLLNESRDKLTSVHADGHRASDHKHQVVEFDEGLAGQAYNTGQVEIDGYMMLDSEQEYGSSVAIPLLHGENIFGVVQLFFGDDYDAATSETSLFEGIGSRVAPLMLSSIAYERSQANALTDATTDLPNERAFYLILENQVAESQRKRDERPLAILALDIKNFEEVNCTFGHAAGDRVLNYVAQTLKDNVRQMDFVARALNDEFLVILPTADKIISQEIIERIHAGFAGRRLPINDTQAMEVELTIGWAAFGSDGETPGQLLSMAQLRKEQMKSTTPSNVLWFPQDQRAAAL